MEFENQTEKGNISIKSTSFFGISFLRKPIFREGFKSRNPKNRKHKNISGKLESLSNDIFVEKTRLQSYNMKKSEKYWVYQLKIRKKNDKFETSEN